MAAHHKYIARCQFQRLGLATDPDLVWLRLKTLGVNRFYTDSEVLAPDFAAQIVAAITAARSMLIAAGNLAAFHSKNRAQYKLMCCGRAAGSLSRRSWAVRVCWT